MLDILGAEEKVERDLVLNRGRRSSEIVHVHTPDRAEIGPCCINNYSAPDIEATAGWVLEAAKLEPTEENREIAKTVMTTLATKIH